ncbi:uncharacterized protein LOC114873715 [Osmia bicornis bicornis]|uniref:uncharacterized protein LOC114873715 n=1 Tax=Osmia bicornis bicornis TaxID=1437191 RepID=UPI001EAF3B8D|nr:uncharacterized protein LOC114873715 [Osmia bicornis bicornis]
MKYLLVISCLLFVTDVIRANEDIIKVLEEFVKPCAQENKIMPEELSKFDDNELEGEDRTRFGCMKACMMKQTGVVVDNEIQEDKFREIMTKINGEDPDKITAHVEVAKACFEEVKENTDECELAYTFVRCIDLKTPA